MSIWYNKPANRTKQVVESTQFLKIHKYTDTSVTRGRYLPSNEWTHPPVDNILFFNASELPITMIYKLECKALFTGAPPIAFINEPTSGLVHGNHKITKFKFDNSVLSSDAGNEGFTGISLLEGSNVATETISSIVLMNSSASTLSSDYYEPKFFYNDDVSAVGYMVEIDQVCELKTVTLNNIPVALRWGSALENKNTTLVSGYLLMTPIKTKFTDPLSPPT